jgi:beta-glucosidase
MTNVESVRASLTLEEKAALTAGSGIMSTVAVERLGIPLVNVTDGPSGARGPNLPGGDGAPSTVIPCGSALGATWDPALAERIGAFIGKEALERGCRGLLAPTINLHRSPLAGRNFECYSEDPLLSGLLAAGFVRGVQSVGVFATVKHFVGNEAEFERASISSVIDERTLRELYLVPFELAIREGGALALMTSYNRLNGRWLTEQRALLVELVREEWGFEGLVMTDWFGVADTAISLGAGLDLEMPGPGRSLGGAVLDAVKNGQVEERDLDAAVTRLLGAFDRIGILGTATPTPDPRPPSDDERALLRAAAADATVLLSNDGTLPLVPGSFRRLAVVGPAAERPCLFGGGSAQVRPYPVESPLAALRAALGDTVIVHGRGCEIDRSPALLGAHLFTAPDGFEVEVFAGSAWEGEPIRTHRVDELRVFVLDPTSVGYPDSGWSMRIRGRVVPSESGVFELALAQSGRARVLVDGVVVIDGVAADPGPGGTDFFGLASADLVAELRVEEGVPLHVVVEYALADAVRAGVRVGFRTKDTDGLFTRAVDAAREADAAVVFVGTTGEWETEGRDRTSLSLPGRQDELIRAVAAVNPRTVVVVNAGAPVLLQWSDDVGALVQCWFGGQEMAGGVADVLVGVADPGGRLPTSVPRELRHNPAHDNFPGENGELRYGEGLFMGYRGYEHRGMEPHFPFGHGLSYTTFEWGDAVVSSETVRAGDVVRVSVPVTNAGSRSGSEVVQCYVEHVDPRLARPPKELKAFAKVRLAPGERRDVELTLDDRSFSYWDPGQPDWPAVRRRRTLSFGATAERRAPGWQLDAGVYVLHLGRSVQDIVATVALRVVED